MAAEAEMFSASTAEHLTANGALLSFEGPAIASTERPFLAGSTHSATARRTDPRKIE